MPPSELPRDPRPPPASGGVVRGLTLWTLRVVVRVNVRLSLILDSVLSQLTFGVIDDLDMLLSVTRAHLIGSATMLLTVAAGWIYQGDVNPGHHMRNSSRVAPNWRSRLSTSIGPISSLLAFNSVPGFSSIITTFYFGAVLSPIVVPNILLRHCIIPNLQGVLRWLTPQNYHQHGRMAGRMDTDEISAARFGGVGLWGRRRSVERESRPSVLDDPAGGRDQRAEEGSIIGAAVPVHPQRLQSNHQQTMLSLRTSDSSATPSDLASLIAMGVHEEPNVSVDIPTHVTAGDAMVHRQQAQQLGATIPFPPPVDQHLIAPSQETEQQVEAPEGQTEAASVIVSTFPPVAEKRASASPLSIHSSTEWMSPSARSSHDEADLVFSPESSAFLMNPAAVHPLPADSVDGVFGGQRSGTFVDQADCHMPNTSGPESAVAWFDVTRQAETNGGNAMPESDGISVQTAQNQKGTEQGSVCSESLHSGVPVRSVPAEGPPTEANKLGPVVPSAQPAAAEDSSRDSYADMALAQERRTASLPANPEVSAFVQSGLAHPRRALDFASALNAVQASASLGGPQARAPAGLASTLSRPNGSPPPECSPVVIHSLYNEYYQLLRQGNPPLSPEPTPDSHLVFTPRIRHVAASSATNAEPHGPPSGSRSVGVVTAKETAEAFSSTPVAPFVRSSEAKTPEVKPAHTTTSSQASGSRSGGVGRYRLASGSPIPLSPFLRPLPPASASCHGTTSGSSSSSGSGEAKGQPVNTMASASSSMLVASAGRTHHGHSTGGANAEANAPPAPPSEAIQESTHGQCGPSTGILARNVATVAPAHLNAPPLKSELSAAAWLAPSSERGTSAPLAANTEPHLAPPSTTLADSAATVECLQNAGVQEMLGGDSVNLEAGLLPNVHGTNLSAAEDSGGEQTFAVADMPHDGLHDQAAGFELAVDNATLATVVECLNHSPNGSPSVHSEVSNTSSLTSTGRSRASPSEASSNLAGSPTSQLPKHRSGWHQNCIPKQELAAQASRSPAGAAVAADDGPLLPAHLNARAGRIPRSPAKSPLAPKASQAQDQKASLAAQKHTPSSTSARAPALPSGPPSATVHKPAAFPKPPRPRLAPAAIRATSTTSAAASGATSKARSQLPSAAGGSAQGPARKPPKASNTPAAVGVSVKEPGKGASSADKNVAFGRALRPTGEMPARSSAVAAKASIKASPGTPRAGTAGTAGGQPPAKGRATTRSSPGAGQAQAPQGTKSSAPGARAGSTAGARASPAQSSKSARDAPGSQKP